MNMRNYDRTSTNESDGRTFYGYDDGEGTTTWYDKDGNADCQTPTPSDDEWQNLSEMD